MDLTALIELMRESPEGTVIDVEYVEKNGVADFEVVRVDGKKAEEC